MSNSMGLTVPTPSVTTGPTYAQNVSDDLSLVAEHQHTGSPDGKQLPTAALAIDDDLSMNSTNLTQVRSVAFDNQGAALVGAGDIRCAYVLSGDLYYNNAAGTPVQVTSGNVVATTGVNEILKRRAVSGNITIDALDTDIFYEVDTSAARTITLPLLSALTPGRQYVFADVTGGAQVNKVTVQHSGADTFVDGSNSAKISMGYGSIVVIAGAAHWFVFFGFDAGGNAVGIGNSPAGSVAGLCLSHDSSVGMRNAADNGDVLWLFADAGDAMCVGAPQLGVGLGGGGIQNFKIKQADVATGAAASLTIEGCSVGDFSTPGGDIVLNPGDGSNLGRVKLGAGISFTHAGSTSIFQEDKTTNGGTGAALLIQAQNETGTTSTGGDLQLSTGTGTSANGALKLANLATTTIAPGAGGGGALPATPAGYVTITINGTARQLPYY